MIIARLSRTLIEIYKTLLEEERREFTMSILKGLENRDQQCTSSVW